MTDHFKHIYQHQAPQYDVLVSREDYRGNLFAVLNEIAPLDNATVVEFGAGTGRLTRTLLFQAQQIYAFDHSAHMLTQAQNALELTGMSNWALTVADNVAMPVPANSADLVIEGWSFGHVMGWYPDAWRTHTDAMLAEMRRILRPGGIAILLETMGTGNRQPSPPTPELAELYRYWQEEHGFDHRWIRTDYQFQSITEGIELVAFFFGDDLAQTLKDSQSTILPECTGIWWRRFDEV